MAPRDKAAILKEFRNELAQEDLIHDGDTIGTDDETLLYNIKHSAQMWKNCQHWRATVENVGIDDLYREIDPFDYPERDLVFDCWPLYFHKTDKEGHPLNFHHFGGINLDKLQKQMSLERFWQTFVVNCEALPREILPASSEAAGKTIWGTFVVVDLSGFGISQFWHMKDYARKSFQVSQDYFPETVARIAIVNAPRGFSAIWNVMKPWIAKETAAKVMILGSDYKPKLLELIDEDALPARLGGTCTCSEHKGGCMKSNAGPWMHEHKHRRAAWLKGERSTIAILPGELNGKVVPAPAPVESTTAPEPESENTQGVEASTAAEPSTSVSASASEASETSSVETSSIATPPPASDPVEPLEEESPKKVADVAVRDVYDSARRESTAVSAM